MITPITLGNHAKPKLKSTGAGRYQLFPVGRCSTVQLNGRLSSADAVVLQQIKERGALPKD